MDQLRLLRRIWDSMGNVPGRGVAFGRLIGRLAPYTGTISPVILQLEPGYARVKMKDRKSVRNHLRSVHAIALMNLAEACSGLAFVYSLPDHSRAILTALSIDYVKKARGTLIAECTLDPPTTNERAEHEIEVVTRNAKGEVVTRARARWLVSPLES